MKKSLLILFLLPFIVFAQRPAVYRIQADSTKISTLDNSGNELIIQNDTKDTLGVLRNTGNGVTNFISYNALKNVLGVSGGGGSQTLSRTLKTLTISSGNTVTLPRTVDSTVVTTDSIIVYTSGGVSVGSVRYAYVKGVPTFQQSLNAGNLQSKNDTIRGGLKSLEFNGQSQFIVNETGAETTDFDPSKLGLFSLSNSDDTIAVSILGANQANGVGVAITGQANGNSAIAMVAQATDSAAFNGYFEGGKFGYGELSIGDSVGHNMDATGAVYGYAGVGRSPHGEAYSSEGFTNDGMGNTIYGNASGNGKGIVLQGQSVSGVDIIINPLNGKLQFNGLLNSASEDSLAVFTSANYMKKMAISDLPSGGSNETVVELGTIDYPDINAAAADPTVVFTLTTNDYPANSYAVAFKIVTTTSFNPGSVIVDAFDGYVPLNQLPTSPIADITSANTYLATTLIPVNGLYSSDIATPQQITISFGGGSNPQDYISGSFTVYGIFKPVP